MKRLTTKNPEVLGDLTESGSRWSLPAGWCWTPIHTVLEPQADGRLIHQGWSPQCERGRAGPNEWGVLRTTSIQPSQYVSHENKRLPAILSPRETIEVREGDLLMTCAGPRSRCGVACLVRSTRSKLMLSGKMYRFRTDQSIILPEYLEALLQTSYAWRQIDMMKTGGSDSGLNLTQDRFKTLKVPLAPLAEQVRIRDTLEKISSDITEGERALSAARKGLDTYRRALLKAAISGELTADWRDGNTPAETGAALVERIWSGRTLKSKRSERSRVSKPAPVVSSEVPEGWGCTNLGELFDIATGTTPSRANARLWGGGIPWVSSGEVAFCRIRTTRETISPEGLGKSASRLHPPGTILMAMIGEGKTRGQCAILDVAATNNQNSAAIRVSATDIPPEFIFHVLEERYFRSRKESQGGNQAALNGRKVGEMTLAMPSLAEVHEILARLRANLDAASDTQNVLDAEASDVQRLRQSVLKAAFEGRLVPQDESDEPASVMLARIAASQAETPRPRRGRPRTVTR